MKTGSLSHFSTTPQTELIGEMTENANNSLQTELNKIMIENSKIPPYASNFKREYQFIRGLNKEIDYFLKEINQINNGLFLTPNSLRLLNIMKRFLRAQEKGRLNKDISKLIFPADDIRNFININENFDLYNIRYEANNKNYPGFGELYDNFKRIFNQLVYKGWDDEEDSDYEDMIFTGIGENIDDDFFQ